MSTFLGIFSCDTTVQYAQQEANRQVAAMLQAMLANPQTGVADALAAAQNTDANPASNPTSNPTPSEMPSESPQIDAYTSSVGLPTPAVENQSESNPEGLAAISEAEVVSETQPTPKPTPKAGKKA